MERRGRSESCKGSKMNRASGASREAGMEADPGGRRLRKRENSATSQAGKW